MPVPTLSTPGRRWHRAHAVQPHHTSLDFYFICAACCFSYLDMLDKLTRLERLRQLQRQLELGGEHGEVRNPQQQGQAPAPLISFTPSVELNDLVKPLDRWVEIVASDLGLARAVDSVHPIHLCLQVANTAG